MTTTARLVGALVASTALTAGTAGLVGQELPTPTFEVASVRQNVSGPGSTFIQRRPGGSFAAGNVTVRDLILYAFDVQRYRIVGMPDWAGTERFDIAAKTGREPAPTPPGGISEEALMLRALLVERFALLVHRDTREMPSYALVLARSDGQLGPQLRRSQIDCAAVARATNAAGGIPPPDGPGGRPLCRSRGGQGVMTAGGMQMSSFPFFLTGQVQRAVVDRTGLTGAWDVDLTWAPEPASAAIDGRAPPIDPRPDLFTALQEQLGLRLQPIVGPVEVLVIDRVQRPTPD